MTVPVARPSARRTVRVAAALVFGQAVLCAVIGYVTLGGPGAHRPDAAHTGEPFAGGPLALPAPAVHPPSPTSIAPEPPGAAKTTTRRPVIAPSRHRPELTPTPPSEAPPVILLATSLPGTDPTTGTSPAPSPEATSPNESSGLPPPSPPTSQPTEQGVTIGDPCDTVDAPGVTNDGTAVVCRPDNAGVSRWQPT